MTSLTLTIKNQSKYDVSDCRVDWEMKRGVFSRKDLGPVFAAANPSRGWFSDPVSYASGRESYTQLELGLHEKFTASIFRVFFYYSSTFSNGEWMEVHYWKTEDIHNNPEYQNWGITHTYDPPKWIPTSP